MSTTACTPVTDEWRVQALESEDPATRRIAMSAVDMLEDHPQYGLLQAMVGTVEFVEIVGLAHSALDACDLLFDLAEARVKRARN